MRSAPPRAALPRTFLRSLAWLIPTPLACPLLFSFEDVHVGVAERLASVAAKTKSVKQFVHLSALGASPDAASDWLRTKFEGEAAVKAAFPSATVVRPATMFGHEDVFLNW